MGKKDRGSSDNQAWLDWLSDNGSPPNRSDSGMYRMSRSGIRSTSVQHSQQIDRRGVYSSVSSGRKAAGGGGGDRAKMPVGLGHDNDSISIRIELPKIRIPKVHIPWRKILLWGGTVIVLSAIIICTPIFINEQVQDKKAKELSAKSSTPSYSPLRPEQGTKSAKYDSKKDLYTYNDTYKGITIVVSQQPLPDKLRDNPDEVKKVAETLGEVEAFDTVNGKLYIATNKDDGIQRAVLSHRQLLLFLQSKEPLNSVDWVAYVQSLQ